MVASVATTVGAWVAIAAGGGSAVVAALSYRAKARADEAESDVRLVGLLAELVPVANGRSGALLSETGVAEVLRSEVVLGALRDAGDSQEAEARLETALEASVISLPVGAATQAAVVTALGELGYKHEFLREPVRSALAGLAYLADYDTGGLREAYGKAMARVA